MKGLGLRNVNLNTIVPKETNGKPGYASKAIFNGRPNLKEHLDEVENGDFVKCVTSDKGTESFSIDQLYAQVGDVDNQQKDVRNTQLVPYFVKEIFSYLLHLESSHTKVRPDFLQSPQKLVIAPRMRQILFDWLVQVHNRLTLQPESLYLTFQIIDSFMSSPSGALVAKSEFQLVGIASMLLASKYEEIYAPSIHDFVYLTNNTYTDSQVRRMERKILSQLDFFLGFPLPIQFLRRYSKLSNASQPVHEMAKYLAEVGRCNYQMVHLPASAVAAAAFCLAAELLASAGNLPSEWNSALQVYSGYSKLDLLPAVHLLAAAVISDQADTKYDAVRKKYSSSTFLMISRSPELNQQNNLLKAYANGNNGS